MTYKWKLRSQLVIKKSACIKKTLTAQKSPKTGFMTRFGEDEILPNGWFIRKLTLDD